MRKASLLALTAALACGKQTFLAAAFVQTPALPNPTGGAGFPQIQVMTAYFGTIDTTDPAKIDSSKIAGITDATASVSFHHTKDPAVSGDVEEDRWLKDAPPWKSTQGTFTLSSTDEPRLTFEPSTPYTLVLQVNDADGKPTGDAYGARLTPGPHEDIKEFENSTCQVTTTQGGITGTFQAPHCVDLPLGQGMTLTRDVSGGCVAGTSAPAFGLVGKVDPNNPAAEPTITYKPPELSDATGLLKYVLSDLPYRVCSVTIPASAFSQAGYYVVTLLTVKQGKVSGNAFLGSTALAASGAAGVVHVQ
jgi:hypothetical protein